MRGITRGGFSLRGNLRGGGGVSSGYLQLQKHFGGNIPQHNHQIQLTSRHDAQQTAVPLRHQATKLRYQHTHAHAHGADS